MDESVVCYGDIRLPEDAAILRYYMDQATVLLINPKSATPKIESLKLLRLKVKLFTEF